MSHGFTHESSVNESVEWYTPPEVFDALGLTFDLDPCSPGPGKSFVPARRHYTVEDDGLASPWRGTVWMNPPYGKHTPAWMSKLTAHGDGIALVFARTDVRWFQDNADTADAVCFISSRVRFFQGNTTTRGGTPGAGSVLIAYGPRAARAVLSSGLGLCFTPAAGQARLSVAA
ncbi:adenine methyltransferase [Pseudactinotalea sp. HY160]|uniref:DNA N-6-adenine-methyltransferase n=1 Tax=Pseudactinotalea sp. HY160 TaxID=2654490 RepID=UPI00128C0C52|nr:DNA N-6-adenine-methyltransferase [Pseudactinotalea sp. HY160]MPV50156.1 adenine methyltransferase [Pseudactinotalea sp. HY160]